MKEPEIRVPIATATEKGMETLSVNGFRVSSPRLSPLGTKGQLPEQNKTRQLTEGTRQKIGHKEKV